MFRCLAMFLLLALATAAAAQTHAPRQTVRTGSDGWVLFTDDFDLPHINRRKWPVATGASQGVLVTGTGVLMQPAAQNRATLRSREIPLDAVGSAVVLLAADSESGDPTSSLRIEFRDFAGRWRLLGRIAAAADPDYPPGTWRTFALPPEALDAAFELRLRAVFPSGHGAWRISGVRVVGYAERTVLSVRAAAGVPMPITVVTLATGATQTLLTPDVQSWAQGEQIALIAPAELGPRVFQYWVIDGQIEPRRALALQMGGHIDVLVHYGRPDGVRQPARLRIAMAPVLAAPIDVALATVPLAAIDPPVELSFLAGEQVTLSAPRRADGWVFSRWRVAGEAQPSEKRSVAIKLAGEMTATAEYVLLGDMNGDKRLDALDVDAFTLALADIQAYRMRFDDLDPVLRGDLNGDGWFDEADVEPFVALFFSQTAEESADSE